MKADEIPANSRLLASDDMFDTMLRDNVQAREMESNGQYRRLKPGKDEAPLNSQEYFYQQAYDLAPKAGTVESC